MDDENGMAAGGPPDAPTEPSAGPAPESAEPAEAAADGPAETRPDRPGGRVDTEEEHFRLDEPSLRAFSRRIAGARERIGDFDTVALNPDLPVSEAMAATIARSERGAEIAYHLGRNPELARRIAGLDPLSAARELGRIEAQLSPAPKRAVTTAPPPLRALGGGESPGRDPDAMSYQEYKAWRRAG